MIIKRHPGGLVVTIPETPNNCEFIYTFPVATTGPAHIRREQSKIARAGVLRAFSMENFFKTLPADMAEYWETHNKSPFDIWSEKNREDWNNYYHTALRLLEEEAQALWREWCDWHFQTYGWNAY